MESLFKSDCLLQILSPMVSACFGFEVFSQCHIVTTNKIEPQKWDSTIIGIATSPTSRHLVLNCSCKNTQLWSWWWLSSIHLFYPYHLKSGVKESKLNPSKRTFKDLMQGKWRRLLLISVNNNCNSELRQNRSQSLRTSAGDYNDPVKLVPPESRSETTESWEFQKRKPEWRDPTHTDFKYTCVPMSCTRALATDFGHHK